MEPSGSLTLRYAVATDVGQRRDANEDSVYTSHRLLAVADGMGGHVAGEVASSAAISAVTDLDERIADIDVDPAEVMAAAVEDAVSRLTTLAEEDPALQGMGTTLTAMLWDGARFTVAHVGDSRAYRLRDDQIEQITRDHTVVQELVEQGRITAEAAMTHPSRSVLTRALQSGGQAEPDVFVVEVKPGDRYLICSDGLTDVVPPSIIGETLATVLEGEATVKKLVELANAGGGPDNITCVVADISAAEDSAADPSTSGAGTTAAGTADTTDTGTTGPGAGSADADSTDADGTDAGDAATNRVATNRAADSADAAPGSVDTDSVGTGHADSGSTKPVDVDAGSADVSEG